VSDVSRETEQLQELKRLILDEAKQQNLISASTLLDFDLRHLEDSRQLLTLIPEGRLLDIGSGAGLPGLVLACLRHDPVLLIEPRTKRAEFLRRAASQLALDHVTVHQARVEALHIPPVQGMTARAVAPLDRLFTMAAHLADEHTKWILPKGRTAANEVAAARLTWQGRFSLVPSRTDPDAAIVVAEQVRRRSS
jgi:16S rRNA (guanine527-N7)-methyltransferase